jgi:PPOX class probable FMN-dependent enzyme
MTLPTDIALIDSLEALTAVNGKVSPSTQAKVISRLEQHSINFIGRCPFLVLATQCGGDADASPRGDTPGFVKVIDETTLLIPERPGNRLADSLTNIVASPGVGLIFMIPGMNETLRINGNAYITTDPASLEKLSHNGVPPKLAIVVDIKQVYFHCAKAFVRSKLWDATLQMPRNEMPTLGKIILEQIKGEQVSDAESAGLDEMLETNIKDSLYHT